MFNITIHPQWQRCGFGRRLLHVLIEQLTRRGVVTLWLEVRASNAAAIALYDDLGFNQVTSQRQWPPGRDCHGAAAGLASARRHLARRENH